MARRHQLLFRPAALLAAAALVFTTACGDAGDSAADSAAAAATPAPADTGMMAGMDHDMAGMNRSAPHDTNQVFLRMMSDHHQGLIALSDSALPKLQGTAKADAQKVRDKQKQEQERMLAMLHATHGDSITPMMMHSNAQMAQAMGAVAAGADSAWYQHTIHHHEEGIRMTERLMPHLTGEVKQMAEKMVADQRKEIEEFQRKLRG